MINSPSINTFNRRKGSESQNSDFYLKMVSSYFQNSVDKIGSPIKSQIKKMTISPETSLKKYDNLQNGSFQKVESGLQQERKFSNQNSVEIKKSLSSELNEEEMCIVCFGNPQNSVNMPCGHGSLCIECNLEIMQKSDSCCICREIVEQVLELDMREETKRNDCWRVHKCYVFLNDEEYYEDVTEQENIDEIEGDEQIDENEGEEEAQVENVQQALENLEQVKENEVLEPEVVVRDFDLAQDN